MVSVLNRVHCIPIATDDSRMDMEYDIFLYNDDKINARISDAGKVASPASAFVPAVRVSPASGSVRYPID
jgi:hypothetical protein